MATNLFSPLTNVNVATHLLPVREDDHHLEPLLDAATMNQHYDGLFAKYTANTNLILSEWKKDLPNDKLANESVITILKRLSEVPSTYRLRVQKFVGGYVNHFMYFKQMTSNKQLSARLPTGELLVNINKKFGSFEAFKEEFTKSAMAVFGSGYIFLVKNAEGNLEIVNGYNQDSPLSEAKVPIIVLDLWEHAYYGKHEIRRAAYIEDWWNLIDFQRIDLMAAHLKDQKHIEL